MTISPYDVLGIDPTASTDDIRQAYRNLAKKYHPDTSGSPDTRERFLRVQEAYEQLTASDHIVPMEPILTPGPLNWGITITLEEAIYGASVSIVHPQFTPCEQCHHRGATGPYCPMCHGNGVLQSMSPFGPILYPCLRCNTRGAQNICPSCSGTGSHPTTQSRTVSLPPFVPGLGLSSFTISDVINPVSRLYRRGSLRLNVTVLPHKNARIENGCVIWDVPLTYDTLVFGEHIEVPFFQGRVLSIDVPPRTNPNYIHIIPSHKYGIADNIQLRACISLAMPSTSEEIERVRKGLKDKSRRRDNLSESSSGIPT